MDVIYSELDGVPCEYRLIQKIGEGGFSKVYKCERTMNGKREIFAAKVFSKGFLQSQKTCNYVNDKMVFSTALEKVYREIALMKHLRHPNIVSLVDVIDDNEEDLIYMILEYIDNGQVMYYNAQNAEFRSKVTGGVLPENIAKKYLFDIVLGLRYLHLHKIVHRDIKPENILVTKDDHCKIADFGVAHIFDAMNSSEGVPSDSLPETQRSLAQLTRTKTGLLSNTAGTIYYYSPECCQDQPYNTYAADMWALGIALFAMVVGRFPLFNSDVIAFTEELEKQEIVIPDTLSPALQDLLKRFLEKDPTKRISIDEVLAHEWMKEFAGMDVANETPIERSTLSTIEVHHALSQRIVSASAVQEKKEEVQVKKTAEELRLEAERERMRKKEERIAEEKKMEAQKEAEKTLPLKDPTDKNDCCCIV